MWKIDDDSKLKNSFVISDLNCFAKFLIKMSKD